MKRLVRHPATQALLARLLGAYLAFALATTRWRLEGGENLARLVDGEPHVVAFWHERLPLMPMLWLMVRRMPRSRHRRVHVLVSHHRDGRFIGTVIGRFDMEVVTGSSSRGGVAGLRALLGQAGLRQGLWAPVLLAVLLLGAVLIPGFGVSARGATRWLRFGGSFGLQPA